MSPEEKSLWNSEFVKCEDSPAYFINTYFQLDEQGDGPRAVLLDSVKEEFVEAMNAEPRVIARYPRVFGKTVTLSAFALQQAIFKKKKVAYVTSQFRNRNDFLRTAAVSYRVLPTPFREMASINESINRLTFSNDGLISIHEMGISNLESTFCGSRFDFIICDEPLASRDFPITRMSEIAGANGAQITVVGTFSPSGSVTGKLWSASKERDTGWTSLPSFNEEWKIETMLSLVLPRYQKGYNSNLTQEQLEER